MIALISVLFFAGYLLITLEHKYHVHKAITAVLLGAILWVVVALNEGASAGHATEAFGSEIFGLVIFLLAAMTLVEILVHYRFFDYIRAMILKMGLNDYRQLWVIGMITFVLSSVIDNLTATLVMLAVATRFFVNKNLLIAGATIVIAANAGGAWSPIGDVTTIMLWIGGKFTAGEIVSWGLLPSLTILGVSVFLMGRSITNDSRDAVEEKIILARSEWLVIVLAVASFGLPIVARQLELPPYFGLLFGLGVVGLVIGMFRLSFARAKKNLETGEINNSLVEIAPLYPETHLTIDIEKNLARTDIAALLFFTGILLAVGALEHVGILDAASHALFGANPGLARFFSGSVLLGVLSAIVDNIPLTAAAMEIIKTTDSAIWSLVALAVGTGGSLLVIGSAAGVVAMGKVKELTFVRYMKIATLPAFVGYVAGMLVWLAEYLMFR